MLGGRAKEAKPGAADFILFPSLVRAPTYLTPPRISTAVRSRTL